MKPFNVKQNITTNYCCTDRCNEIYNELFEVVDRHDGKVSFILKKLVEHFRRIVSENASFFKGELALDLNWSLLNEINEKALMKIKSRKKYSEDGELCVTFAVLR